MKVVVKKKVLAVSFVLVLLLAVLATGIVWGKGHVPAGQVQVCHKGRTAIDVDAPALKAHVGHGDGQLPACDFNNVFHVGDSCPADGDGDGFADLPNPRESAEGITPGCPPGTF